MRIAVCGCSFSSIAKVDDSKHWSQLLGKLLNAEIINFAISGVGNVVIRSQIEAAIKSNPDYLIVNATFEDRIEIPNRINKKIERYTVSDFTKYNDKTETIVSLPLSFFAESKRLSDNQKRAIESYIMEIYNDKLKRQTDQWILASGLWELHEKNIMFTYDPWILDSKQSDSMPQWFKEKYYIEFTNSLKILLKSHLLPKELDPGYHLDDTAQKIIAQTYADRINNYILTKER